MSDWDFLYDLSGQALTDAQASGAAPWEWDYIWEQEERKQKQEKAASKPDLRSTCSRTARTPSRKRQARKANTLLLIDGENISCKKASRILKEVSLQGNLFLGKVYGLQKDSCTQGWSIAARESGLKDIRLFGPRKKGMVDQLIKRDALKEVRAHKNIDIVCIASSDGDYYETLKELHALGKRTIILGEEKTPSRLRENCSRFICIK